MNRFFEKKENIKEDYILLKDDNFKHLSVVLRAKPNEEIIVCDGEGNEYLSETTEFNSNYIKCNIISKQSSISEPRVKVTLYMALTKGDKNELIIQKCVELGVTEIFFFISQNCVSKPDAKSIENKLKRFNTISLSAAKQSHRGVIPKIYFLNSISDIFENTKDTANKILFYEGKAQKLSSILHTVDSENLSIIIGPEGGFLPKEVEKFTENNFKVASLGSRILRAETAPLAALSAILYHFEEM